jgi:hypothetical protein
LVVLVIGGITALPPSKEYQEQRQKQLADRAQEEANRKQLQDEEVVRREIVQKEIEFLKPMMATPEGQREIERQA